jgi:hypothetical protein
LTSRSIENFTAASSATNTVSSERMPFERVLEDAVAEAVPGGEHVPSARHTGQGGRRPDFTGFLVTQIDRLAAGIG